MEKRQKPAKQRHAFVAEKLALSKPLDPCWIDDTDALSCIVQESIVDAHIPDLDA